MEKTGMSTLKAKKINIPVIVAIVLTIVFNNETLSNNLSNLPVQPVMLGSLFVITLFLWMLIAKKQLINIRLGLALISLIILILISFLIDGITLSTTNAYMLIIMALVTAFIISNICDLKYYQRVYINTLFVLSLASILISYILKPIISATNLLPVVTNSAGVSFYNSYITYVVIHENFRNYGIFREPGVFAIFIVIAIAFLLKQNKINLVKFTVLVVALITTFSIPGYIAFLILLSGNLNKLISRTNIKFVIILTSITFLFLINSFFGYRDDNILQVFEKLNSNSSSFQFRAEAVFRNIQVWALNPIFGSGIISGNELLTTWRTIEFSLGRYHNTSTLTSLLVFFGVGFSTLYFVFLYKFCKKVYVGLAFFLAMILLLNSQLLIYNTVIYTLIMYGAQEKILSIKRG